jgi:hypothetical protein
VKWMRRCQLIGIATGMLGVLLLGPNALARGHKEHPYRYSDVDMPVSLSVGTVRTPEFPVGWEWYDIMVQAEKPLPFQQMQCMMGVTTGPLASKDCSSNDPLLRADWTVWDGDHIVDHGSIPGNCACKFENKYMYKFLGSFSGEGGKKYVVEVKFTKDGTPLNVANPHLIVIPHKNN